MPPKEAHYYQLEESLWQDNFFNTIYVLKGAQDMDLQSFNIEWRRNNISMCSKDFSNQNYN